MAVRNNFAAGEVLLAADLNDTFASKLNIAGGRVLQVVNATRTTQFTSTSYNTNVFVFEAAITPQLSTSTIYALLNINTGGTSGGGRISVECWHGTTSGNTSGTKLGNAMFTHSEGAIDSRRQIYSSSVYSVAPGNTTTRYFKCLATHLDRDSSGEWYVSLFGAQSSITLFEVTA